MGKRRFYDAVRDLIRDSDEERARSRRRLSIASLLAAPLTCAACWDTLSPSTQQCHACVAAFCTDCLAAYARSALRDRSLLPLRCAAPKCREPVPLPMLRPVLAPDELDRLRRFQQERGAPAEALVELMESEGWRRCPDCGMGVERSGGCPHMVCLCGGEFCYACGGRWRGGCPRRCGWPELARLDDLREEVWVRIQALLERMRRSLEEGGRQKMRVGALVHPTRE